MRRIGIAILVCATVLVGRVIAQGPTNVTNDASAALAVEWKDIANGADSGIMQCLNALDVYTSDQAADSKADALTKLVSGAIANPKKPTADQLYRKAKNLQELLATATTISFDENDMRVVNRLFKRADDKIAAVYVTNLNGLDEDVNKVFPADQGRALYSLLNLYANKSDLNAYFADPFDPAKRKKAKDAADLMELYRTCYAISRDRFFGLVSRHFP
jgi:hypothetical protein